MQSELSLMLSVALTIVANVEISNRGCDTTIVKKAGKKACLRVRYTLHAVFLT
jgi:hypothetical protein